MLSNTVFIDTGGLIAFLSTRDDYAARAKRVLAELRRRRAVLVTSSAVIFELLDGAALRDRRMSAHLHFFLRNFDVEVIHVQSDLLQRAWTFYDERNDKQWSLTDCVSFVLMDERNIDEAFAHDHHFDQAGFIPSLRHF